MYVIFNLIVYVHTQSVAQTPLCCLWPQRSKML